ncbi:chromate transporter [Zhaonella formicivorans]|uniref:chromate transporter n=1 Tax=Zhaonella formicivorans TaxID=2528593 RepID=UPI0010EDB3C0|nr:chromate transporter [Zhaonella formicivorans]
MLKLWQLFVAFFRVGILGFGGGPSSIPLVKMEVVDNFQWMSPTEFSELLALANALPGPIATKLAGYIGYKVAGISGLIVALSGTIMPSLLALLLIFKFWVKYKNLPAITGMTKAILPVVGVMLAILVYETFFKSISITSPWVSAVIGIISFILIKIFNVHDVIVVILALAFGAIALK